MFYPHPFRLCKIAAFGRQGVNLLKQIMLEIGLAGFNLN
jgi:hypothetical protein